MTGKRRQSAGDGSQEQARPELDDAEAEAAKQEPTPPVIRPVREKIGEGDTNLRDRQASISRRRGGPKPST